MTMKIMMNVEALQVHHAVLKFGQPSAADGVMCGAMQFLHTQTCGSENSLALDETNVQACHTLRVHSGGRELPGKLCT